MAETTVAEDIANLIWENQHELADGNGFLWDLLDRLASNAPDIRLGDLAPVWKCFWPEPEKRTRSPMRWRRSKRRKVYSNSEIGAGRCRTDPDASPAGVEREGDRPSFPRSAGRGVAVY